MADNSDNKIDMSKVPSKEEVLSKLDKYGVELTPEQLDDISGGSWFGGGSTSYKHGMHCPYCGEDIGFNKIPKTVECPLCLRTIEVDESMLFY